MLYERPWRTLIKQENAAISARSLTGEEQTRTGKDPVLMRRLDAAAKEYRAATKESLERYLSDTWFFPVNQFQQMGAYNLVVGWNHAVVLRPVGMRLYCVEWILKHTGDQYEVHGGIGVDVEQRGSIGSWTVFEPCQKPWVSQLATFTATSCSVSVAFPSAGDGRIIFSHIDAAPPIPFGAVLDWLAGAEERDKKSGVIRLVPDPPANAKLLAIASTCPQRAEADKFADAACLGKAQSWPPRTITTALLTRGKIRGKDVCPMEFNTQAGLVFKRGRVPRYRAFLGTPKHQYRGLVPQDTFKALEVAIQCSKDSNKKQGKLRASIRKIEDGGWYWKKKSDLRQEQQLLELESTRGESFDRAINTAIQPLLKDTHGHVELHRAICKEFNEQKKSVGLAMYAALTDPGCDESSTANAKLAEYFCHCEIELNPTEHAKLLV